jgi:gamma-glutamyltranspeptidase/glutathione hydrolase
MLLKTLVLLVMSSGLWCVCSMAKAGERLTPSPGRSGRAVVMARQGMVATSHPLAAQIGLDVLKNGGNAIDAAIATNAALGLMEPMSCGIGGDLYALKQLFSTRLVRRWFSSDMVVSPEVEARKRRLDLGLRFLSKTLTPSWFMAYP